MKAALRDRDYLQHILEAIGKIQRFVAGKSEADFFADDMAQDAVIRNLEIIGEAVIVIAVDKCDRLAAYKAAVSRLSRKE